LFSPILARKSTRSSIGQGLIPKTSTTDKKFNLAADAFFDRWAMSTGFGTAIPILKEGEEIKFFTSDRPAQYCPNKWHRHPADVGCSNIGRISVRRFFHKTDALAPLVCTFRRCARLSRREFNELVKDKQITLPFGISDFEAELETLRSLGA